MPRLTSKTYLIHRNFLIEQWTELDGVAFADMPLQDQLDLHDYYAPSVPISDEDALQHRMEMTKAFPSLPQKAGRAYEALRASAEGRPNKIIDRHREQTTTIEHIAGELRSLRVVGIARPKIDQYRLARALVNLAAWDVDGELLKKARKGRGRRSD